MSSYSEPSSPLSDISSSALSPISLASEDLEPEIQIKGAQLTLLGETRKTQSDPSGDESHNLTSQRPEEPLVLNESPNRPSRKRGRPAKFHSESASLISQAVTKPDSVGAQTAKNDVWHPQRLLHNSRSRLASGDLVGIFTDPEALSSLNEEQEAELIQLFPIHMKAKHDSKKPSIDRSRLKFDTNYKEAVRNFQDDLRNGRYSHKWVQQAIGAVEARKTGAFDDFLARTFESTYEEIPPSPTYIDKQVKLLVEGMDLERVRETNVLTDDQSSA